MDYTYTYSDPAATAAAGAGLMIYMVVLLAILVVNLVAMWKIFDKAGYAGWKALIPIYNMFLYFELTWGSGFYMFLMLIPFANIIIGFITYYKLAKAFGKGAGFTVGLIFLPVIFLCILAFGPSEYEGC